MHALLFLLIIGVAATAMSVNFANTSLALNVQKLGVGEAPIETPLPLADVNFIIKKEIIDPDNSGCRIINNQPENCNNDEFVRNRITHCLFHADYRNGEPVLPRNTELICKLTDNRNGPNQFGNVIAEGRITLTNGYCPSTAQMIPITQEAFPNASDVDNVNDFKIIVITPLNPIPPTCPTRPL
ncbi:MAG: hypothetical protein QXU32_04910 [Nitrososphaerales archaeon]